MSRCKDFTLVSPLEFGPASSIDTPWVVSIVGAPGTLYADERFELVYLFGEGYPFEAPSVTFKGTPPKHEHIYSNGHICMSLLADDWSPALSIDKLCQALLSMLSTATVKRRPKDDKRYMLTAPKNPKKTKWDFHDESC